MYKNMGAVVVAVVLGLAGGAYAADFGELGAITGADLQSGSAAAEVGNIPSPSQAEFVGLPAMEAADPGRSLTTGEINMAFRVFGTGVDYGRVRIFNRKWIAFQPENTIMAPDGNIFYPRNNDAYSSDFSGEAMWRRLLFIHEMTHVYQHQQGIAVVKRRLGEGGKYSYMVEPDKDLNDYTVEQQGNMVMDYYRCLARAQQDKRACMRSFAPALDNFVNAPEYLRKAELDRLAAQRPGAVADGPGEGWNF